MSNVGTVIRIERPERSVILRRLAESESAAHVNPREFLSGHDEATIRERLGRRYIPLDGVTFISVTRVEAKTALGRSERVPSGASGVSMHWFFNQRMQRVSCTDVDREIESLSIALGDERGRATPITLLPLKILMIVLADLASPKQHLVHVTELECGDQIAFEREGHLAELANVDPWMRPERNPFAALLGVANPFVQHWRVVDIEEFYRGVSPGRRVTIEAIGVRDSVPLLRLPFNPGDSVFESYVPAVYVERLG